MGQLSSVQRRGRRFPAGVEPLEGRVLFSTATINAGQNVRAVATQLLGVNTATWDGLLSTSTSLSMAQSAGLTAVRLPGGSSADYYHFNANPAYEQSLGQMAEFGAKLNATSVATVNYGTGSPQEGVAMWAYLNGSPMDTTVIGTGPQFDPDTNTWSPVNWQTVGYWAGLRAASPLSKDDGLNFLRLGAGSSVDHPGAFNVQDWEVGNEEYGSWEIDGHAVSGGGVTLPNNATPQIHDPATYIAFAKAFTTQVRAIIATEKATPILIGLDVPGPDNEENNWTANILKQSKSQQFTPDFLSDHSYDQAPGEENDSTLLADPTTAITGTDPLDWAQRAVAYQKLISTDLGSAGANVQLLATEINSVYGDPGKQSTSLVNGLFLADSLGSLMETPYNGAWVWDLHNGGGSSNNDSASLYGWREYGDYGIIGNGAGGTANQANPNYFAEQLASKIIHSGGQVVSATSDNALLDTFAVKEPNGDLELLVINKEPPPGSPPSNLPDASVNETFRLQNFLMSGAATIYQYGVAEDDTAAKNGGYSSLTQSSTTLGLQSNSFSYAVPDYSMTVIDLKPDTGPTVATPAAGPTAPVLTTGAQLNVSGAENGSDAGLTYTWSATGPAPVTFSSTAPGNINGSNGTNAAKNIEATFTAAGTYQFTATITDAQSLSVTSSTTVTVAQDSSVVSVSPANPTMYVNSSKQFSATAYDQFGNAISGAAFTWSTDGAPTNTISSTGLLSVGNIAGSLNVDATQVGGVEGNAAVSILPQPITDSPTVNGDDLALAGAQRSMVDSVVYFFNAPVTLGSNAFTLAVHAGQTGTVPTISWSPVDPDANGYSASWIVTFSGAGVVGNSIADGVYDLTLVANATASAAGATNAAASTFTFDRLFGDANGDGVVNLGDFGALTRAFGTSPSNPAFVAALDYNNDGVISLADFGQFTRRFGKRFTY